MAVLVGLGSSAVALACAPALMADTYSWISHTTSESAAQGVSGGWLARLGFLLFGLSVMALAVTGPLSSPWWSALFHYAFGAFMVAAAAFSARPHTGGLYDRTEDALHSVAATAMGFVFAAGVVATALRGGRGARIGLDVTAVVASVAIPLAMSAWPAVDGALQRTMFAVAYAWYAMAAVHTLRGKAVGSTR